MNTPRRPVVLYHANCNDGFGAAWAAYTHPDLGPEAEYVPVQYGDTPPDVTEAMVYILDFSFPADVLRAMAAQAYEVVLLDHHVTAEENLAGLRNYEVPNLHILFDRERSGAVISWDVFHPAEEVPVLLQYVQDRDLWRWELPLSHEVNAGLTLYPHDFAEWSRLASEGGIEELVTAGAVALKREQQMVASISKKAGAMTIGGHRVPAVNSPILQSEIGHALGEGVLFSAVYFLMQDKAVVSLRSREGGADVQAIAKQYGGGGHTHAAGFSVSHAELIRMLEGA